MEEPSCCKCGKKYYENILEVVDGKTSCVSCSRVPRAKSNILSRAYYRYRAEYGLTLLGRFESIVISKSKS